MVFRLFPLLPNTILADMPPSMPSLNLLARLRLWPKQALAVRHHSDGQVPPPVDGTRSVEVTTDGPESWDGLAGGRDTHFVHMLPFGSRQQCPQIFEVLAAKMESLTFLSKKNKGPGSRWPLVCPPCALRLVTVGNLLAQSYGSVTRGDKGEGRMLGLHGVLGQCSRLCLSRFLGSRADVGPVNKAASRGQMLQQSL